MDLKNLASQCGLFCGACRTYLMLKKDQLEERGYKRGCEGCLIRNKNCTFFKKKCSKLRKREVLFCFECDEFPCDNFDRLEESYVRYGVSLMENCKRMEKIGVEEWVKEQLKLYTCPECGGEVCVHELECFDCGATVNPNNVPNK